MEEQDIKKVWEQGFRKQQVNLSQEEINQIRKRKSANLIEQIRQTAKADQKTTPFIVLVVVGAFVFFGYIGFGIFLGLLLTALYFLGGRMIKKMEAVEIKESTLAYVTEFRDLLMYMKGYYIRLIGFGMLLLAIPLFLLFIEVTGTPLQEAFAAENRSVSFLFMLIGLILFPASGVFAYLLSTKILYGKKLKRLDEMIADLNKEEIT